MTDILSSLGDSLNPQNGNAEKSEMTSVKIKVLVADEQPIVREGILALIARQPDMEIVGEARNGDGLRLQEEDLPNVVLFDLSPPFSGLELVKRYLPAKVVAFTSRPSEEHIYQAMQAGVRGYLLKSAALDEIIGCIRAVAEGRSWIPPGIADLLARRMAAPQLTRREKDVLGAMAEGKSNKDIGALLGLSEGTVKVHISHILEKLKVSGRTEALATAAARGLVSLTGRSLPTA